MKEIKFCRATRDFEMFLDGRSVGFAATHRQAEITLDQMMYDQLAHDAPVEPMVEILETVEAHYERRMAA